MAADWFYLIRGKQLGPISAVELKDLARQGGLKPDDYVWQDGMPDWVLARSQPGLFPPTPPPPPGSARTDSAGPEESSRQPFAIPRQPKSMDFSSIDQDRRLWAMCLHLSVFLGFFIPVVGFVVPILIWQLKKNEFPEIDQHGIVVVNWMISVLIYFVVSALLALVFIGIPLLFVLVLVSSIFPVVGALKANEGIVWPYPGSIKFL